MSDVKRLLADIKDRDVQTEQITDPRLLPLGQTGTKYDHARRWTSTYHLDSPYIALGDRHVLLARLPDYEAAVSALERLTDRYWTVPSAYRVKYGLPTRTTVDAEMDDEDRDRQWLREHVNGILARLREKVPA